MFNLRFHGEKLNEPFLEMSTKDMSVTLMRTFGDEDELLKISSPFLF
jgi:hypothetical protein